MLVGVAGVLLFTRGEPDIEADLTPASGWIIPFDVPQDLTVARYTIPREELDAMRVRIGETMARDNTLSNRTERFYGSRGMAHFNSFIPFKNSFAEEPEDPENHSRWTFEAGRLVTVDVMREGAVEHVERIWHDDLLRPILTVGYGGDGNPSRYSWGEYDENGTLRRVSVFWAGFKLTAIHIWDCDGDYDS